MIRRIDLNNGNAFNQANIELDCGDMLSLTVIIQQSGGAANTITITAIYGGLTHILVNAVVVAIGAKAMLHLSQYLSSVWSNNMEPTAGGSAVNTTLPIPQHLQITNPNNALISIQATYDD